MNQLSTSIAGRALWLPLLLCACGDYVAYEGEPPGPVSLPAVEDLDPEAIAALTTLDHLLLEGVLARHVEVEEGHATVDYVALDASAEAKAQLVRYLAVLEAVDPAKLEDPAERLAFWMNAYNAAVLVGVLADWGGEPEFSVSDKGFAFFARPGWKFAGLDLSLNEIEHGVIRGDEAHASLRMASEAQQAALLEQHATLWDGEVMDARIHVGLNCASFSCPNLRRRPWLGPSLDADLAVATSEFLANPEKGAGPEGISALFAIYAQDFATSHGSVTAFIQDHREDLDDVNLGRFLPYSWDLNAR